MAQELEGCGEPAAPVALKYVIEMSKIDLTMAQAKAQPLQSPGRLAEVWLALTRRTVCQTHDVLALAARAWNLLEPKLSGVNLQPADEPCSVLSHPH